MARIILVIHNVRSALNVGSMLRTAEGFRVEKVYMTGYTPYPEAEDDSRLPHHRRKTGVQIHKTALGAENFVKWQHRPDIDGCFRDLKDDGYMIVALEQTDNAVDLNHFTTSKDIVLIVGNEIDGLDEGVLNMADRRVQIPMRGRKESFNVAIAAGIALYHLRYTQPRQK